MSRQRYDAIAIGVGQAGKPLAVELAGADLSSAVIERVHVGGASVNVW